MVKLTEEQHKNLTFIAVILFGFVFVFAFLLNISERQNTIKNYSIHSINDVGRQITGYAWITPPSQGVSYIERNISNLYPLIGVHDKIQVKIYVRSNGSDTFLAIDERLPLGITVNDIISLDGNASLNDTPGGNDNYQHIKWIFVSDNIIVPNATFNYTINISRIGFVEGDYVFTGQYNFESDTSPVNISGWDNFSLRYPPNNPPLIILNTPENGVQFNNTNSVVLTYTVVDDNMNLLDCNLILNGAIRDSRTVPNNTAIPVTINGLSYGSYSWYVRCFDGTNYNNSIARTFTLADTLGPTVLVQTPNENTVYALNEAVPLEYTTSDPSGVSSCWYFISYSNSSGNGNLSGQLPGCLNITDLSFYSEGIYTVRVYSNDTYNNTGNSSTIQFEKAERAAINYNQTAERHSSVEVEGNNVIVSVPINLVNLYPGDISLINFTLPKNWYGALNYFLYDGESTYPLTVINGNTSFVFNGSRTYSLNIIVPPPGLLVISEFGNLTNYQKNFTVTSPNHFINVSANISINSSYNNYLLYWYNGSNYVVRTNQYSLRIDVPNNRALFGGFNTSDQNFYIIGSEICSLNWNCTAWSSCNSQGIRTRTVSCDCYNTACISVGDCDGTTQTTLGCGTGSTGSGGSGSASSGGSSSSGGGYTSSISSSSSSSSSTGVPQINITPPPPPPRFESVDEISTVDDYTNIPRPFEDTHVMPPIVKLVLINWYWILGVIIFAGIITVLTIYALRIQQQRKAKQDIQIKSLQEQKIEELKKFIRGSLDRGKTPYEIKQSLENVGWKDEIIDNYINDFIKK